MLTLPLLDNLIDRIDLCPWGITAGRPYGRVHQTAGVKPLYTIEERRRRDATPWTLVQAVLAPIQFAACLISVLLVLRFLATGDGFVIATGSIIVKTLLLYTIMVTGSIWERVVFGRYLFASAFFWEDVCSILVLALHTAYLAVLLTDAVSPRDQMYLALAAYATYGVNATQFVLKMRAARIEAGRREPLASRRGELAGGILGQPE